MLKSDLRTGMFVTFEGGLTGLILLNTMELGGDFIVFNRENYSSSKLDRFANRLSEWMFEGEKVVKVSCPAYKKYYGYRFEDDLNYLQILWERKKTHTISIDGVEKEISDESFKNLKSIFDDLIN